MPAVTGIDDLSVRLVDALNASGEEFGEEGIISVVNRAQGWTAGEVMEAVTKAALDFSGDRMQLDDMTMIVP